MFEPRKLMPLSIELWSAPIAVMTEMTEKTPIVIPVMVSAERSLFAPSEVSAMTRISRKRIGRISPRSCLLVPKRRNGIKPRRRPRRSETRDETCHDRDEHAGGDQRE